MRAKISPADRLRKRLVADEAGCLNWTGALTHNGYGEVGNGIGGKVRVHRLAYEVARGPISAGLEIDHLCRNRRCCNPDHLEAVTREENIARGNAPHIVNAKKTECKHGHPFSPENTRINRRGARVCIACESGANATRPSRARPNADRGRFNRSKVTCAHGHPLSGDNLRLYRGERACRACASNRSRARHAARALKPLQET